MDKITALIPRVRKANGWDALSNEEVLEQALLKSLCCGAGCPNHPIATIEFFWLDDEPDG